MKVLIVFVAACAVLYAEAKPAGFDSNEIGDFSKDFNDNPSDTQDCHGIQCPSGTVACSKTTKTSPDRKVLHTTIQCEDFSGTILNSATKSTENPFENTQISSFSFTGHYNYGTNTVRRPTYTNTYYNNNNNNDDLVETFA